MTADEKNIRKAIAEHVAEWAYNNIGEKFTFRLFQKDTIVNIIYNIVYSNENRCHVIEAPTGSGKSLINIIAAGVLADFYNMNSYILCSDLFLWDQYAKFISSHRRIDFGMIKGQTGNYTCMKNGEDMRNADCRMCGLSWASMFNPETAHKYKYDCASTCEYVRARKKAIKAKVVLMTYQLYFYQINVVTQNLGGTNSFAPRDIIFCDECHNIPDIVQAQHSPTIRHNDFDKLYQIYDWAANQNTDLFAEAHYDIIDEYTYMQLKDSLEYMWSNFIDSSLPKKTDYALIMEYRDLLLKFSPIVNAICGDISKRKQAFEPVREDDLTIYKCCTFIQNCMCFINDFSTALEMAGEDYVIKQVTEDKNHEYVVAFNCTKEDAMCHEFFLKTAPHIVMTSATIGGKAPFEQNMGAKYTDKGEFKMDVMPSTFDYSQSPVIFLNRYKMSYKEKDKSFESLKPIIYNIIDKFAGKKGIIQTGSYALAQKLVFDAPAKYKDRLLLYNGSKEKTFTIQKHRISDDTILVGPTLCEGIDLPDDDCRFIVILKVPYPSLTDKLVKEKIELFPLWYKSKTSNSIIQGIGRGVRNDKDYCTTYILDGCFFNLYTETKDQYAPELQGRYGTDVKRI